LLDVGSWSWLDAARLTELRQTTLMYDGGDAEVAGMYLGENRLPVDVSALPEHVRMAFVAAEDARFFSHHGIDLWRIGGAMLTNLKSGGYAQGASTISQQLIKLTHLTAEKTLSRKANEAVLALMLEARYSKEEILGMYMNAVYFGHGAYGIEAAARAYFSKGASELTVAESALMAAVIKSPSGYAPHIAPEKAQKRRDWVLGEMERLGFISPEERAEAQASAIALNESHGSLPEYGWYIDYALGEAEQALGLTPDELLMGGYRIYTELDAALQSEAQRIFDSAAFPVDGADGTRCQGALCAVENGSGAIRALVGGREYEVRRGLNRATDVRRQPGSAIKPLAVYAPAVDKFGYLPTSFLSDVPTDFDGWSPRNAGDRYRGIVTLRQTAMSSINVATVELLSRIGVKAGVEFLHSVGIGTDPRDEVLPLALGAMTYGVSPLELCGGYSALASGGVYRQPYAIRRILDARGRVVYEHDGGARRVMSEQSAYIMTSMLKSTAARGTASRLSALGAEVAAKTGTAALGQGSDGNRDIWLAAYTPGISVSVWMGFDRTGEDCHLAASASGSNQPTRLALAFLGSEAAAPYVGGSFARPAGLREVMIDGWALENLHSVLLAGESTPAGELMREIFTPGALPGRVSTLFDEPLPAYDVSAALLASGSVRIEFTCPQEFVQYRVYRLDGEERVLVGTLAGEVGQRLTLTDTGAPDASRVRYDVTPYAPAQDAEGLAATVVLERTLWDELGRWFAGPERQPADTPAPTAEQPGGYAGAEQAVQPDAPSPSPAAEPTPASTAQREQGQPVNPFAIG
ncbi:MAG: PBP1A family penicillin-binding protein, partial [Candidatus Fimadaptatus sp.]